MENLMEQVYDLTKTNAGLDVNTPIGFKQMLGNEDAYETYRNAMADGLKEDTAKEFKMLADNTRLGLLENNNMMQFNPYETLAIPLLRKYFPRLVATQAVNVIPMDMPEIVKYFIYGRFKKNGESNFGHTFPVMNTDISRGPSHGVSTTATSYRGSHPGDEVNILTLMSLTSANAHIEKDFKITGVLDSTGTQTVTIAPDVDGNFSQAVTALGGGGDVISGHIDFDNGVLSWSSRDGTVTGVTYEAYVSLEENAINPTTKFDLEKIRIISVLRQISAEWTLPFEQDTKALFNLNIQSQIVNMIGEQIALDIDREILQALVAENSSQNNSSHTLSFDLTPAATFDGTQVEHFRDILYKLNTLSAQIYDSSQMGAGNVIVCDPLMAAVLESINTFRYDGTASEGGDLGYATATIQGGKYRILVSSVMQANKMMVLYRSNDAARAVYVYCPYIPTLLTPYPLGNVPSLTVMSRYGVKSLRPEGIAMLNIAES